MADDFFAEREAVVEGEGEGETPLGLGKEKLALDSRGFAATADERAKDKEAVPGNPERGNKGREEGGEIVVLSVSSVDENSVSDSSPDKKVEGASMEEEETDGKKTDEV